jgi:osmotically-inducible protein OsmY
MGTMNSNGDLLLAEGVARALRATGFSPLRQVTVAARDGSITLLGRVSSLFLKQMAQETARTVPGVLGVVNSLDVLPAETPEHAPPVRIPG